MTARRLSPAVSALLATIAAATCWVALSSWRGFVASPSEFLRPAAIIAASLVIVGSVLRWLRLPRLVVTAVQLVTGAAATVWSVTGSPFDVTGMAAALTSASESARTYAAPVSDHVPPVTPLLLLGCAFFLVLMDAIVATFHRVAVSGLVLLAAYSVPSGLTTAGPNWAPFVGASFGFVLLLAIDAHQRWRGWGQELHESRLSVERAPGSDLLGAAASPVRSGFLPVGASAIVLALVVPPFIPMFDTTLLGLGAGAGGGEISIRNPRADLRRDLERGADVPLIRMKTNHPAPSYLRVAVLNRFTGSEWSSGDRDVSVEQNAERELPPPEGLDPDVPVENYWYEVEVTDQFDSTWLPTQYPITEIGAGPDWRYDLDTMDFLAIGDENAAGSSYTMTGVEPQFGTDGRWFADAPASAVDPEVLEVPGGIPASVRGYAQQVTEDATTDYERARLLQAWFRSEGGFEYELERAPRGSIGQTLERFLSDDPGGRVGYCEQFAAAMAIMARMVGIPARVAIGFLEATDVGDDLWEYSSHDLHAWPELYFSGAGWVRFEPTPADRADTVPDYSTVPVRDAPGSDPSGQPQQSPSQDATQPQVPRPSESAPAPQDAAADADAPASDGGTPLPLMIAGLGAGLVGLAALLVLPRALRRRQSERRLSGSAEDLWREVRASVTDHGMTWPHGRSPREAGTILVGKLRQGADGDPESRPHRRAIEDALEELVVAVERTRYARPWAAGGTATLVAPPRAAAETLLAAVSDAASTRQRRRASWAPRSLRTRD